MSDSLFKGPQTFMGVPRATEFAEGQAAIVGIPFDCGTDPYRIGSRQGPAAIRRQSVLLRPFQPLGGDLNPLETLNLVDAGDIDVVPSAIEEAFVSIEQAMRRVTESGATPVALGGDGSITLPPRRAVAARYPGLAVLHIDAHTDSFPGGNGIRGKYNTGTTFQRAAEEGLLDVAATTHLGLRGFSRQAGSIDLARDLGYGVLTFEDLAEQGQDAIVAGIRERIGDRPVYLCFDMDFFDPSCAPGVCAPTPGGASAAEGLRLLRAFAGLNFVAFDINTVSPPHDLAGMTALLAGHVVLECLVLACHRNG